MHAIGALHKQTSCPKGQNAFAGYHPPQQFSLCECAVSRPFSLASEGTLASSHHGESLLDSL